MEKEMKPFPKKISGVVYIYVLVDPRTHLVRYVGGAVDPKRRFYFHLYESKELSTPQDSYKVRWVRKLLGLGLEPSMIVFETTTEELWEERETYWIAHYRKLYGTRLTNAANGGRGWHGMHHTPETKKRFSEWQTGRSLTPEHRENISKGIQGHSVSEETREKQRIGNLGKIISAEQKKSIGIKTGKRLRSLSTEDRKKSTEKARLAVRLKRPNLTSQYRGVCRPREGGSWAANIHVPGGKSIGLGSYPSEVGAASAYNREARRLYGKKSVLNNIPGGEIFESRSPKGNNKPRK